MVYNFYILRYFYTVVACRMLIYRFILFVSPIIRYRQRRTAQPLLPRCHQSVKSSFCPFKQFIHGRHLSSKKGTTPTCTHAILSTLIQVNCLSYQLHAPATLPRHPLPDPAHKGTPACNQSTANILNNSKKSKNSHQSLTQFNTPPPH